MFYGRARKEPSPSPSPDAADKSKRFRDGRKTWDDDESERILEAAIDGGWEHGMMRLDWNPDWAKIGEAVRTRNAKQCRERWENFADPVRESPSSCKSIALRPLRAPRGAAATP